MVEFEAEEPDDTAADDDDDACGHNQYRYIISPRGTMAPAISGTNRRCSIAAGDGSSVESDVSKQPGALIATLLIRVTGARLVALVYADCLSWLVVGAPAFLVLQDCVGEFALAFLVAEAKGLVDVLA